MGNETKGRKTTMMYGEYESISGTHVDYEVYDKLIEPMYKAVPWIDKHDFIGFLNTEALAKTTIKPDEYHEPWYDVQIKQLTDRVKQLQAQVDEQHTRVAELETQLRYERAEKARLEERYHSACDLLIDVYSGYEKG
jgi:hypothetical protein